jgi:hypothetical protein
MKPNPFAIKDVYGQEVANLLSSRKKSKLIHSSGDIDASGDEVEVPFRDLLRRRLPNQYFVGHGHIVDQSLNVSPQFDVVIADNNATPILFEAENGCQFFPWESVFAVGEIKASYQRGKHPVRKFAESIAKLKTQLVRLPTPPSYLGNGVFLEGFESSDERKVRNPLFPFMVFFDSGAATQADLADEYCATSDEYLPVVASFLDGSAVVKAEIEKAQGGIEMGPVDLDPLRVIERKDIHWMQVNYKSQSDGGAQALVILMLGLFDHLNRCILMPPPINDYLNAITHTAANHPLPLSVSALVKQWQLSGKPIPSTVVRLFEHMAARGKSPFRRFAKKDIVEFRKESGITKEELIRCWPEIFEPEEPSAEANGLPPAAQP